MTAPGWNDADLAWLERCYDTDHGGHDDAVTLIRGVRAVLALHVDNGEYDSPHCAECRCDVCGDNHISLPCRTLRALNLDPIGDTP